MLNRQMLPSSHSIPIDRASASAIASPQVLADAFSQFISASAHLEGSYKALQEEVGRLNAELGKRNSALTRSLAENARNRAALEQLLDSMPCGVLVVDAADRVVVMNPECCKLLQLQQNSVHSVQDVSIRSDVDFASLAQGCDEEKECEIRITRGQRDRWLAIRSRNLTSGGRNRSRLQRIWILRDVTAEREAERAREGARRTAVLAEISTILAHEIRNPLASMELFAGLIEQDEANAAKWISNLRAGIRSLSGTVNNVLNLNNPNALPLTPVNLVTCVESGVEFVRPIAEQDEVSLIFAASSSKVVVCGNENAIQQIVLNLVSNAIRYSGCGGEVRVIVSEATRQSARMALITVTDTGCGIPNDIIGNIFEPGFSGAGDSPGLGLAVCKRLAERLGGNINVSSKIDCGTTLQVEIPIL
jgi:signal transduction histidine kinase